MTASPELDGLPKRVSPRDYDRVILIELAARIGVEFEFVYLENFEEMIPALIEGRGDIIADNLGVNEERKKLIAYTDSLCEIHDQIIAAIGNSKVNSLKDLPGRTVFYEAGTAYLKSLEGLRKEIPSLQIRPAELGLDTESLMHHVGSGKIELAITDSNYTDAYLDYSNDIKIVHTFPEKLYCAWGLRKDSPALLMVANKLIRDYSGQYGKKISKGDLPTIIERKVLRVLTRNNPHCYYVHKGHLCGFEYELAKEFAKRHKLSLVMVVPPKWSDMIPWLIQGKGDIIAASMGRSPERDATKEISECEPYLATRDRLVGRSGEKCVKDLTEIAGRKVHVRRKSGYWEKLEKLKKAGHGFELIPAPEELETFEIIEKVADGEYDLTVSDEHIFKLEKLRRADIADLYAFEPPERQYWWVRSEDTALKRAVDEYFKSEYKGIFFNCLYKKYYGSAERLKEVPKPEISEKCVISKFDGTIERMGLKYGVDPVLVMALIYQESRFDPKASSQSGAKGLMQILPKTAAEMGFKNPDSHEENIHAGVKYLSVLKGKMKRFDLMEEDIVCFMLASYNCGFGHLLDARKIAGDSGLDPDRWFSNVEKSLLMLEKPQHFQKAKHGYCRASETVAYVREIILRYNAYMQERSRAKKAK